MLFSLYLLATLYTNTMGLIILAKINPIIKHELELNGYVIKDKDEVENAVNILVSTLKFLIFGYYLNKALKLSGKDFDIEKVIKEKLKTGEIETSNEGSIKLDDSIFRDERKEAMLSKNSYVKPYKATSSMYTKDRLPNRDDIDRAFWEEDEDKISSYVVEEVSENTTPKKEPLKEYFDSMSEEDVMALEGQLKALMELKKAQRMLLNKKD